MDKQKKGKKIKLRTYIGSTVCILIGGVGGYIGGRFLEVDLIIPFFISAVIALLLQTIIHEAGHLVFGLMTGYEFSSFRIANFMLLKENNTFKFKKLSIAGTGGQCLMVPPNLKEGKIPFALYNMGGSIMNIISSLLSIGLYLLCKEQPYLAIFWMTMSIIGITFALINGIPMRLVSVDNDGYNAFSLGKSPEALQAFWIQLKANEQIARGVRVKDMPAEWFQAPSETGMKNSMIATRGVLTCSYLVDCHLFKEADELMEKLLNMDSAIVGLHRRLMLCDRIYCELIGDNRPEVIAELLDKTQKSFMKSMKNFPSVLRTEYVYAVLGEKDNIKAEKIMAKFEKCMRTYPYPSDAESEKELMDIATSKAEVERRKTVC